jgi:uncharacterized protein YcbK (DUF882 family)
LCAFFALVGAPAVEAHAASASERTRRSPKASEADGSAGRKRAARRTAGKKRRQGVRQCQGRGKKRRCRWVPYFEGRAVAPSSLRTEPLPTPSGDIVLVAVNFREEVAIHIYQEDGVLDESALAALDQTFRCRRTREQRAVDPRLYEILSIIYDRFGRRPIELVSGFRFQRNEGSRHYHASAMDIRIPGVSTRELYEFAESLDTGGMGIGIYPESGFVHIDFRAPGEKSYRWIDRSGKSRDDGAGKRPSPQWTRRSKPTS